MAAGQLTLQYHCGGGQLTGQVGRLFAQRTKMSKPLGMTMAVGRPLAHLATARSLPQLRQRLALYFTGGCPAIPVQGTEGERMLLANAAAMNYGFAFRTATYGTLSSARPGDLRRPRRPAGGRLAAQLHLRGAGRRTAGHRAPAQLLPRLPGVDDAAGHGVRHRRPGPPGAGHTPHLLLPLRGRGRSRTEPVLRLPRRRDADQPVRQLRPVRPGPTAPASRCASATARTSPPRCRNSTTAAWTRPWRS